MDPQLNRLPKQGPAYHEIGLAFRRNPRIQNREPEIDVAIGFINDHLRRVHIAYARDR
jgi:hypothetical protein